MAGKQVIFSIYVSGIWKDQVYPRFVARQIFLDLLPIFGPELGLHIPQLDDQMNRITVLAE